MRQAWHQHPWLRRLAFLAGNAAAGLLFSNLLVLPLLDGFAERDARIAEQREILARLQTIAAQGSAAKTAAAQPLGQGEFLAGKNEGVINADLQTHLKGMAGAAGARVRSVRVLPPQLDGADRYIGSRIELTGNTQALHRAIYAVETAKPYLFVKGAAFRLTAPTGPRDVPHEPVLEVQLDIYGLIRTEGGER